MSSESDSEEDTERLSPQLEGQSVANSNPIKYLFLPTEIVLHVLELLPRTTKTQKLLYSACLVSRCWYNAGIRLLYRYPRLYSRNFKKFVDTVCPSVNAHIRRSELAMLVEILDMESLVHDGSKSLTARLLSRTKGQLQVFVAPRATFAVNSLAALTKCQQLHTLDLTLISSASSLESLFRTLSVLPGIRHLHFPRSVQKIEGYDISNAPWPPNLETLRLGGNLSSTFFSTVSNFPPSLYDLTIEQCTYTPPLSILHLLTDLGPQFTRLDLSSYHGTDRCLAVDELLLICPALLTLSVPVELVGVASFRAFRWPENEDLDHPLDTLIITTSASIGGMLSRDSMGPHELVKALEQGLLPNLKTVRIDAALNWHRYDDAIFGKSRLNDLKKLADILAEDHGAQDGVGVWITERNSNVYSMMRS